MIREIPTSTSLLFDTLEAMRNFFPWLPAALLVGALASLHHTPSSSKRPVNGVPFFVETALADHSIPRPLVNTINLLCGMMLRGMKTEIIKAGCPDTTATTTTTTTSTDSGAPVTTGYECIESLNKIFVEKMAHFQAQVDKELCKAEYSGFKDAIENSFMPRITSFCVLIMPALPLYLQVTGLISTSLMPQSTTPQQQSEPDRESVLKNALLYECHVVEKLVCVAADLYNKTIWISKEEHAQAKNLLALALRLWQHSLETVKSLVSDALAKTVIDFVEKECFRHVETYIKTHIDKVEGCLLTPNPVTVELEKVGVMLESLPAKVSFVGLVEANRETIAKYSVAKDDKNLGLPYCIEYYLRVSSSSESLANINCRVAELQRSVLAKLRKGALTTADELRRVILDFVAEFDAKVDGWRGLCAPLQCWLDAWAECLITGHPLTEFNCSRQELGYRISDALHGLHRIHLSQYAKLMQAASQPLIAECDKKALLVAAQRLLEADQQVRSRVCSLLSISMLSFEQLWGEYLGQLWTPI